jgi:hypothetical protein
VTSAHPQPLLPPALPWPSAQLAACICAAFTHNDFTYGMYGHWCADGLVTHSVRNFKKREQTRLISHRQGK